MPRSKPPFKNNKTWGQTGRTPGSNSQEPVNVPSVGCPLKPAFGLSGQFDGRVECSGRSFALSRRPFRLDLQRTSLPVAGFESAFNISTLNFAKNAKVRIGHPPNCIEAEEASTCGGCRLR
jgi:hypothetical protein